MKEVTPFDKMSASLENQQLATEEPKVVASILCDYSDLSPSKEGAINSLLSFFWAPTLEHSAHSM